MREENIVTIGDYLRTQFTGCTVEDEEVSGDHVFRVMEEGDGEEAHRLQVSEVLLDDTAPMDTAEGLESHDVASFLRKAGKGPVILTPDGPEILGE